jgi:hypothetical protein
MTETVQLLSQAAASACDSAAKVLLYAEVEDGAVSADLFFEQSSGAGVKFKFAPRELREAVYEYWGSGDEQVPSRAWATLKLVIANGKFQCAFEFPDDLKKNEELQDRRPRVVLSVFGNEKIDYSNPNG